MNQDKRPSYKNAPDLGRFLGCDKQFKSAVNLTAIANLQNQDAHHTILDVGNDSVVAHAVLPKLSQLGALECFANTARVIKLRNALTQERHDALGYGLIKLGQLFERRVFKLNPPSQGCAPHRPENG